MDLLEKAYADINLFENTKQEAKRKFDKAISNAQKHLEILNTRFNGISLLGEIDSEIKLQLEDLKQLIRAHASSVDETAIMRAENRTHDWYTLYQKGICAAHRDRFMASTSERICSSEIFTDKMACLVIALIDTKIINNAATNFYGPDCLNFFKVATLLEIGARLEIDFNFESLSELIALQSKVKTLNSSNSCLSVKVNSFVNPIAKPVINENSSWYDRVMQATKTTELKIDFEVNKKGRLVNRQEIIHVSQVKEKALALLDALEKEKLEPLQLAKISERRLLIESNNLSVYQTKKQNYMRSFV